MTSKPIVGVRLATALIWAVLVSGCSKEKLNELVEQGKQKLDEGVQKAKQSVSQGATQAGESLGQATGQAKEALQLAGTIELDGLPLKTNACYARFIPATGGRPAILSVQSYRDVSSETFPSVYLRAVVSAAQISELAGQTVTGELYVQAKADGPVRAYASVVPRPPGSDEPVQLKIISADSKQLVAEIVAGRLVNPEGGSDSARGRLTGVWLTLQP